jgi:hypothetical protein
VSVCGDVYVMPSTTIEPDGLAVTVIDTVSGDDVDVLVDSVLVDVDVLVEFVVVGNVELVVEFVVVVVSVVDVAVELEVVLLVVVVVVFVVCDPIVNVKIFSLLS